MYIATYSYITAPLYVKRKYYHIQIDTLYLINQYDYLYIITIAGNFPDARYNYL